MGLAETKNTLDKIAERIPEIAAKLDLAGQYVNEAVNELVNMGSKYSEIITEIDAKAAADPTHKAWALAQSEKNELVIEFQALKTYAQSLKDAINAVPT